VKARRARARERLPSCREPEGRNPHEPNPRALFEIALLRAPFRLLSARAPRQAVLASFFPASALSLHEALRPPSEQDARCVRPTSATRTIESARTSRVPGSLRSFRRVDAPRSLGSVQLDRGTGCFTTPGTASAYRHSDTRCLDSRPWRGCERRRFIPTAPDAIDL